MLYGIRVDSALRDSFKVKCGILKIHGVNTVDETDVMDIQNERNNKNDKFDKEKVIEKTKVLAKKKI